MDWQRLLAELGVGTTPPPTRFVAHGQLVEACAQPGCPVCRCLRMLAVRALEGLLAEHVTDPETRERLTRSWGFCGWHAALTREVDSAALGTAIVYEPLLARIRSHLEAAREALAGRPARAAWWARWRGRPRPALVQTRAERPRCPACVVLGPAEAGYLHVVLQAMGEADFARSYAGSGGLCLPHLTLALARFPDHPGLVPVLARAGDRVDELARALRGFIDKHDHRSSVAFTDVEAGAWTSALSFVAGQPELFGHEIPRDPDPRRPAAEPPPARRPVAVVDPSAEREQQLRDLHEQLADAAGRASALQYRLRIVEDDRKVLELNLAGERGNSRTWETLVRELRAEVAELRRRLGEPAP
jgi:hypothetical protein